MYVAEFSDVAEKNVLARTIAFGDSLLGASRASSADPYVWFHGSAASYLDAHPHGFSNTGLCLTMHNYGFVDAVDCTTRLLSVTCEADSATSGVKLQTVTSAYFETSVRALSFSAGTYPYFLASSPVLSTEMSWVAAASTAYRDQAFYGGTVQLAIDRRQISFPSNSGQPSE